MNKKVLLKDIAEYVGVSTALVSYVINNKEKEERVGAEKLAIERINNREQKCTNIVVQPNLILRKSSGV